MYADRDRYVGDPAFVPTPVAGLLDETYVASRARLIGDRAGPVPTPGPLPQAAAFGPDTRVRARDRDSEVVATHTSRRLAG